MVKRTLRAAAVQMEPVLGDVDANLAQAERLAHQAFDRGAACVILPEFFTSGVAFHPALLDAACPLHGAPTQLLRRLAHERQGAVGGSFLAQRGADTFNTFVLAFPDGSLFFHDKDQPTMWENCYYIGGQDDGVLDTPLGRFGAALCWELIRTRTVRRLLGRVDLVVSGACWWGPPVGIPADHPLRVENLALLRAAPVTFARLLGVPVIFASHAGEFDGFRPPDEAVLQRRPFCGETQIVDGRGNVLGRLAHEDGQGVVVADVSLGAAEGERVAVPDGFWIPDLPPPYLAAWQEQNRFGADYYQRVTRPHHARPTA